MTSPTFALALPLNDIKNVEEFTKVRTVGRVKSTEFPLISIKSSDTTLTINLERCIPEHWQEFRFPDIGDTVMVWGEIDMSEQTAFNTTIMISITAIMYRICNELNIDNWNKIIKERLLES